jgi:hypothetical protein
MERIDSSGELRRWSSTQDRLWTAQSIKSQLKVLESPELSKATVALEAPNGLAIITVWGSGTLEIIVLDPCTRKEVLFRHREFGSSEELRLILDEYSRAFVLLIGTQTGI